MGNVHKLCVYPRHPCFFLVVATLFVYVNYVFIYSHKYPKLLLSNSKHKSTTQPTIDYASILCNIHVGTYLEKKKICIVAQLEKSW